MGKQEIAVNTGTLVSDIAALQNAIQAAEKSLNNMFKEVQELDAMWDGPANQEFNRQFAIDHENTKTLCETVRSLAECMEYAKGQYDSCENQVHSIVDAISIA